MDAPFPTEMMPYIEKFFIEVHPTLIPGQDLYPEVFETSLFFPLQRKKEMRQMIRLAKSIHPKTIMEIGCDKGGGLFHWCMCCPTVERVIANEIRGTPYNSFFREAFRHIDFYWMESSSRLDHIQRYTFLKWATKVSSEGIDVLFIDGDKTKMVEDFDAYLPMMNKEKGIVFIHDIQDREPKKAFETIRDRGYKTTTILDTREVGETLERQRLLQPLNAYDKWVLHWCGRSCGVGIIFVGEGNH